MTPRSDRFWRLRLTQRKSVLSTLIDGMGMECPTTMLELVAKPLPPLPVRLAFRLMRQVLPTLTLDGWVCFSNRIVRNIILHQYVTRLMFLVCLPVRRRT